MGWMDSLRALFGRVADRTPPVPEPELPPLVFARISLVDSPEMVPSPKDEERPCGPAQLEAWQRRPAEAMAADLSCTIEYVDAQSEETTRRITVRKVERRGGSCYLVAYCHERGALRTFLLDRVRCCWDCATGEIIDLQAYIDALVPRPAELPKPRAPHRTVGVEISIDRGRPEPYPPQSARNKAKTIELAERPPPESDPPANEAARQIMERCGDGMRVLRFLSLVDGADVAAEHQVLLTFAQKACKGGVRLQLPPVGFDSELALTLGRRMRPDHGSFLAAIQGVALQGKPMARLVLRSAIALIEADGEVHELESRHAEELKRMLKALDRA